MVVSERDLSVVFQHNVGLVWIPCLDSLPHTQKTIPPLSEGPWRPRQPVLKSLGNAGCASEQSFESSAMAQPAAVGHPSQGSFGSQHFPGNKHVSFTRFQTY